MERVLDIQAWQGSRRQEEGLEKVVDTQEALHRAKTEAYRVIQEAFVKEVDNMREHRQKERDSHR